MTVAGSTGISISHIAHLGGALTGALIVFLLSRIPAKQSQQSSQFLIKNEGGKS